MAAPLRSALPGQPKSMQFAHFGVLDTGAQSKASTVTSLLVNVAIAFVVIVLSLAHKQIIEDTKRLTVLTEPVVQSRFPNSPKSRNPKLSFPR